MSALSDNEVVSGGSSPGQDKAQPSYWTIKLLSYHAKLSNPGSPGNDATHLLSIARPIPLTEIPGPSRSEI